MADVLREARGEAPQITFELRPMGRRANEDLESGELDFLVAPEGYVSPASPRKSSSRTPTPASRGRAIVASATA